MFITRLNLEQCLFTLPCRIYSLQFDCDFVTISAVENGNLFSEGESESRSFLLSSYELKEKTDQVRAIQFVIYSGFKVLRVLLNTFTCYLLLIFMVFEILNHMLHSVFVLFIFNASFKF